MDHLRVKGYSRRCLHQLAGEVCGIRSLAAKRRMRPPGAIERDVVRNRGAGLGHGFVGFEVDRLVLERSPEAFDEDVVLPATAPVHADGDAVAFEHLDEGTGRELRSLVDVDDLGRSVTRESLLQSLDTELRAHCVADPKAQHLAAVEVQDRHQAVIWVACTPWREASSASVALPRNASRAMRALNFDEWFLRDRFMAFAPLNRHRCRYHRAVRPLIPARFRVQKSEATFQ